MSFGAPQSRPHDPETWRKLRHFPGLQATMMPPPAPNVSPPFRLSVLSGELSKKVGTQVRKKKAEQKRTVLLGAPSSVRRLALSEKLG